MEQISIVDAIEQICEEKGIAYESVLETIESALAAAYRKDFGNKMQNIKIKFNPESGDIGDIKATDVKIVVDDVPEEELAQLETTENAESAEKVKILKTQKEEDNKAQEQKTEILSSENSGAEEEKHRFNPKTEIQISEAKKINKKLKIGDELVTPLVVPGAFGRMAAQTAKQVIIQKLREAERDTLYNEYKEREGEVLIGTIQRREGRVVLVDLGRITAIMIPEGQINNENYLPGQHLKVYVVSVEKTTKGPEIIVSRSHANIVRKLFETEIPEIANGVVKIKSVAREAGFRTKIAVYTEDENIDPIGSCIGQRGARVQTIIAELKGEKIDIIEYSDDSAKYIANALSPAKIADIKIEDKEKKATVIVNEDQFSLAIGRAGQNVRLASQLTGWKIDIASKENNKQVADEQERKDKAKEPKKEKNDDTKKEKKAKKKGTETEAEKEK